MTSDEVQSLLLHRTFTVSGFERTELVHIYVIISAQISFSHNCTYLSIVQP